MHAITLCSLLLWPSLLIIASSSTPTYLLTKVNSIGNQDKKISFSPASFYSNVKTTLTCQQTVIKSSQFIMFWWSLSHFLGIHMRQSRNFLLAHFWKLNVNVQYVINICVLLSLKIGKTRSSTKLTRCLRRQLLREFTSNLCSFILWQHRIRGWQHSAVYYIWDTDIVDIFKI